jgi:four helix bundle protein
MADFKKLEVWHKAHALVIHVIQVTAKMREVRYAPLRGQIIRAALSITANIVEGREQDTDPLFARYLRIAIGSASELEGHLLIAAALHLITPAEKEALLSELAEVRKMLIGLWKTVSYGDDPT